MFEKGWKGGPGRPKGSKDKKWATLPFWMEKLEDEWDELKAKDRAYIALEAWKTLVKRIALPPDTSEESVINANQAFELLKRLNNGEKVSDEERISTGG